MANSIALSASAPHFFKDVCEFFDQAALLIDYQC